jgi:hypothetical protein
MAAAGTARTAAAKAGPAPEPRWNFFKGFWTNTAADFPRPSLILSQACKIKENK